MGKTIQTRKSSVTGAQRGRGSTEESDHDTDGISFKCKEKALEHFKQRA